MKRKENNSKRPNFVTFQKPPNFLQGKPEVILELAGAVVEYGGKEIKSSKKNVIQVRKTQDNNIYTCHNASLTDFY